MLQAQSRRAAGSRFRPGKGGTFGTSHLCGAKLRGTQRQRDLFRISPSLNILRVLWLALLVDFRFLWFFIFKHSWSPQLNLMKLPSIFCFSNFKCEPHCGVIYAFTQFKNNVAASGLSLLHLVEYSSLTMLHIPFCLNFELNEKLSLQTCISTFKSALLKCVRKLNYFVSLLFLWQL